MVVRFVVLAEVQASDSCQPWEIGLVFAKVRHRTVEVMAAPVWTHSQCSADEVRR